MSGECDKCGEDALDCMCHRYDTEKTDRIEKLVVNLFLEKDLNYVEGTILCFNIIAFMALSSGFTFEKFKQMCEEQAENYEECWPIG